MRVLRVDALLAGRHERRHMTLVSDQAIERGVITAIASHKDEPTYQVLERTRELVLMCSYKPIRLYVEHIVGHSPIKTVHDISSLSAEESWAKAISLLFSFLEYKNASRKKSYAATVRKPHPNPAVEKLRRFEGRAMILITPDSEFLKLLREASTYTKKA